MILDFTFLQWNFHTRPVGYSRNSITSICCGFVIQRVVYDRTHLTTNQNQIHNKSK